MFNKLAVKKVIDKTKSMIKNKQAQTMSLTTTDLSCITNKQDFFCVSSSCLVPLTLFVYLYV